MTLQYLGLPFSRPLKCCYLAVRSHLWLCSAKVGENYGLYLPAHIHGSEFTCSLDSGGGDRIYLDRGKASAPAEP